MALQKINLGAAANDGTGDPLRIGGQKINENFDELDERTLNANLQALAGLSGQANRLPYFTGSGALSLAVLTALGRQLIAITQPSEGRDIFGLGSAALAGLGVAGGAASLGADGKLLPEQTPDMSINNVYPVSSQAAMLALAANRGDIAIRTDELNKPYILTALPPTTLANWTPIGQSLSSSLAAISGLTPAADKLAFYTGSNTADLTVLTAFARALLDDSNAATARATLGLGTAAVAAIVGTVSQVSGVPTGAVIERGSNSNGEYVKFADGTMVCTLAYDAAAMAITSTVGAIYQAGQEITWTYPASFVGIPTPSPNVYRNDGTVILGIFTRTVGNASMQWRLWSATSFAAGNVKNVTLLAFGRWF